MSTAPPAPLLPRDARLIALLLAANGAEDCEEGVVRMLVEFAHRQLSSFLLKSAGLGADNRLDATGYTSDILTDSLIYAEHAKQGTNSSLANLVPSLDDVRLAVQARTDGATVPKELLLQLATQVNASPLPAVPEVYGIRLPPAASRLTAPNFSLVPRSAAPPPPVLTEANQAADNGVGMDVRSGATPGGEGGEGEEDEDEEEGDGLFGEDDDDDDDDDEEMEDVDISNVNMAYGAMSGEKRKAESDEEYDS
ncbi:transcription initiation factor TFIID subunit 9B, partial [Phenoliferia sp. Uapishka_3]